MFSRPEVSGFRFVDLNQVISSTLNLTTPRALPRIKIVRELERLPQVRCNSAQIGQAIVNLVNNALDAVEDQGTVTIRSRLDEKAASITVEVEDNGRGMTPDAIQKAFEPFFTTKGVGKGTGLGLSITFGIAQAHGGALEAESVLGKGSTFRLKLPVNGPEIPSNKTVAVSG
jgi:signal transduction histidine kinase